MKSWGKKYGRPHMTKCDEEDNIWLIDDGGHALYLYTPDGELLKTVGTPEVPGEDGSHFNAPTDIAFGVNGDYYITDGYGNRRVAHFDQDLNFIGQWGSEGLEEGQFVLPHAVTTDDKGLVYVADRNRWRVQIFSPGGEFRKQWTHIGKPFGIVYHKGYLWICDGTNARVTKVDKAGKVLGFFGTLGDDLGQLSTAHDISLSPNGDILIGHLDGRAQLFAQE
jgi:DNA-binding beta-propeller fold protein YncE